MKIKKVRIMKDLSGRFSLMYRYKWWPFWFNHAIWNDGYRAIIETYPKMKDAENAAVGLVKIPRSSIREIVKEIPVGE